MKRIILVSLLVIAGCLVFYAGFSTRTPYTDEVTLLYIGEVPGTTRWQVIYEYQGNQYSQIFGSRFQAESWVK